MLHADKERELIPPLINSAALSRSPACLSLWAVGREEEDPSGANEVPGSSFVYFTCTRTWSSSNLIALKMHRDKR